MTILIILPVPSPPAGGNRVFSDRLRRYLATLDLEVRVATLDAVTGEDLQNCDIVHIFNASRTAVPFVARFGAPDRPLVITFTGTDVNEEMKRPDERARIVDVANQAQRLLFLTADALEGFCRQCPELKDRCRHMPLGIDVPESRGLGRTHWGWEEEETVFFLPAGLRPVKRPLDALEPLSRLYQEGLPIRLCIAGAVFDLELLKRVEAEAAACPWFQWLGAVPHLEMGDLYRCADVVLNTSASEGLSHALLEAMAVGKAVLASRVPGNRDLIRHGEDGLLYGNSDEFAELARRLVEQPSWREDLGRRAAARVAAEFSPVAERDRYADLYRQLTVSPCTSGRPGR
ncbi:MAG: glycosyltransferase [Kyrpidia sp.]|nr:glycosyltransferase [Kyrpidia sp.]